MRRKLSLRERRHNYLVFIICLLISGAVYANYRLSLIASVNYVIPLEIMIADDKILTYQETEEVQLLLSGRQKMLDQVSASDLQALVDLSSFSEGNWSAPIQINEEDLNAKKLAYRFQPTAIAVNLEQLASKELPIDSNITGYPGTGYALRNYELSPPEVTVSGPASIVTQLTSLSTERVDITGRSQSYSASVNLQLPHPLLKAMPSATVVYNITMQEQTGVLTLSVPINVMNLASRLQVGDLTPSVAGVTIQSGQIALANLSAGAQEVIKVRADASAILNAGLYLLPLEVSLPTEFTVLKIEPENVSLAVRRQEQNQLLIPSAGSRATPSAPILPGPLGN